MRKLSRVKNIMMRPVTVTQKTLILQIPTKKEEKMVKMRSMRMVRLMRLEIEGRRSRAMRLKTNLIIRQTLK